MCVHNNGIVHDTLSTLYPIQDYTLTFFFTILDTLQVITLRSIYAHFAVHFTTNLPISISILIKLAGKEINSLGPQEPNVNRQIALLTVALYNLVLKSLQFFADNSSIIYMCR